MVLIKDAKPTEFEIIRDIAFRTWPSTYGSILSKEQLDYMLELFYSIDALKENVSNNHHFLIAWEDMQPIGFASYEHNYKEKPITRIPKIYVLPTTQGKGVGKLLVDEIQRRAKLVKAGKILLNVNRNNKALGFYQYLGFHIAAEEDIELEHGYLMEDYIMEKLIDN